MSRFLTKLLVVTIATTAAPLINFSSADEVVIRIEHTKKGPNEKNSGGKLPFTGNRPSVDVAILLDTSNSMDGLINQAKSQLWNIVQQFAEARKRGKTPLLRVSIFEYGNTRLPASEGYIRQVVQLTDNLDKVSEALFGLSTSGGDEYCGTVINEAIKRLDWNGEPNAYKAIFIAGNEPFTQGSVDYKDACKKAIERGVVVNTIHCGDRQQGIRGKWQHGAHLAEGEYLNIDQDRKVVHIKCPQDKIIIELNNELNKTYLWYGKKEARSSYRKNQALQDSNAGSLGSISQRAATKAGALYSNRGRDLIDSYGTDPSKIAEVAEAELPEALQKMNANERAGYVKTMAARRDEIKRKIAKLTRERAEYVKAQTAAMAADPSAEATLGDAVAGAVQKQLEESGFELKQ